MKEIYFDNAATTIIDEKVLKKTMPYYSEKFGNASSSHLKGYEASKGLEKARTIIAKSIGAKNSEIYFTSGGTESNNWVLKGLFFKNKSLGTEKNHIITTKIEHDCILNSCKWLESQGAEISYIDVDKQGFLDLDKLKNSINENTLVVSVIHGNNEIGVIQDIKEIGKICREKGVFFHTDACQSFTKTNLNVLKQNLDFVTLNSHKIHGPKGVGALYIKESIKDKIDPLLNGGGHESGMRSGTENIHGIVGFGRAVKIANKKRHIKKMRKLRDKLIEGVLEMENVGLNGSRNNRLCNNINIRFNNIEGESLAGYLESKGIYVSTGSACSSNTLQISHVLTSIGLNPLEANSSIRITLSRFSKEEEIDYFLRELPGIVNKLRKMSAITGN